MDHRRHLDSVEFFLRNPWNRNEQAAPVLRHHYLKLKLVPRVYPRGLDAEGTYCWKLLGNIGKYEVGISIGLAEREYCLGILRGLERLLGDESALLIINFEDIVF